MFLSSQNIGTAECTEHRFHVFFAVTDGLVDHDIVLLSGVVNEIKQISMMMCYLVNL
jgi:hypothetical protein